MSYKAICTVLLSMTACFPGAIQAQDAYPAKPISIVVPYPAGGLLDGVARLLAPKLRQAMGQPIVVDNRGGAGGIIGADFVAKSPADGYTLLFGGFGPNAVNASIFTSLPYDPAKDFAPVIEVFRTANVLVVGNQVSVNSVQELTDMARQPGAQVAVATAGKGSATHLFAELYRLAVKADLNVIPYRGDAPAITAMLGGEVQAYFAAASTILPHVKTGRLRALAVTSKDRFATLPDVPTLAQAGVPNYEATAWYGLYAPAGTPQDVIARLNGQINAILQQPGVRKALMGGGGVDIIGGGPEVLKSQTDNEIVRWREVVKSANLQTQ